MSESYPEMNRGNRLKETWNMWQGRTELAIHRVNEGLQTGDTCPESDCPGIPTFISPFLVESTGSSNEGYFSATKTFVPWL